MDISRVLTDQQLSEYEIADPFVETFIAQTDKHIVIFESLLLPENYQVIVFFNNFITSTNV